jgi:cytochrome P450
LDQVGREAGDEPVRLDLGFFRPYLLTQPQHVQHVLRDNAANYVREGMMWKPFRRLVGNGIGGEGRGWEFSRKVLQPVFSGRSIAAITDEMGEAITEAVDDLERRNKPDRPVDAGREMTRFVQIAIIRVFFGNRISLNDADRLGDAIRTATLSLGSRMLLPFVPHAIPLPGDGPFMRAVRTVDEVMLPIIQEARRGPANGDDVISLLLRARSETGEPLTDRQIRDDVVSLFVAGSESTAVALTWLWVALDKNPQVATRLHEEVEGVVGGERPGRSHVRKLTYTKLVLQELMRVYSVGWIVPRTAAGDDVIAGIMIKKGATILISPYLTHRLATVWRDPDVFDPERFLPERVASRHRFSYLPFGVGPHQCLGSNFFMVEAQLIVAAMLTRFRPVLRSSTPIDPQVVLTLRPRQRVEIALRPSNGTSR